VTLLNQTVSGVKGWPSQTKYSHNIVAACANGISQLFKWTEKRKDYVSGVVTTAFHNVVMVAFYSVVMIVLHNVVMTALHITVMISLHVTVPKTWHSLPMADHSFRQREGPIS
jgi:hypothetical protein